MQLFCVAGWVYLFRHFLVIDYFI